MGNMVALTYLVKMGGTTNHELTNLAKEIWYFLQSKVITVTAKYLPESLNMKADHASSHFQDRNKWLLCMETFQKICQKWRQFDMDLFPSGIFYQVPAYMSLKPDPQSRVTDVFQQRFSHLYPYAVPPIFFNNQGSEESKARKRGYDFNNSFLANVTLIQPDFGDVRNKFSSTLNLPKISTGSPGQLTPINSGELSSTSGMKNLRKNLEMQGISERASKLIAGARRQGTISNYQLTWGSADRAQESREQDCILNVKYMSRGKTLFIFHFIFRYVPLCDSQVYLK